MEQTSATLGTLAGWICLAALAWYALRVVTAMGLLWWAERADRPTTTTWAWRIAPRSSRRAIRRILAGGILGIALAQPLALAETCPEPPAGVALLDRGMAPCVDSGASTPPPPVPEPVAVVPPTSANTVTVVSGDSLWRLTEQTLGTSNVDLIALAWPQLYERNKQTIGANPHLLVPGQVLTVPAEWAQS